MASYEKYINPFTDFGFKRLFGTEFNKELLKDFLNQVLEGRESIEELTYLNVENHGRTESERKAVYDLYCINEKGERFIIEVQNVKQQFFKDRSIFYSTFAIQSQAEKGREWDYNLKAVYTVAILNFSFPDVPERDRFKREIQLLDVETFESFYQKLTFIYLEMPRFRKTENELVTPFDKWMYVLKNLPNLQKRPLKLQEKVFEKLFSEAELARLTPEDMKAYDQSQKVYWDNYSVLKTAREEGRLEGHLEGEQKGRREAIFETARALKINGAPLELIEKSTGLSREEIEKL